MYKNKLTLGVVTAAALLLSLGSVSPALADDFEPTPSAVTQESETPTDEIVVEDAPGLEEEAPTSENGTDEQASTEEPSEEEEVPVEGIEPEIAVETPADEATMPDASARAVAGSFTAARLSNPGTISNPTSGYRTKELAIAVDGPQTGAYNVTTAVALVKKNSGVRASDVKKPDFVWTQYVYPTQTGRVTLAAYANTTPGVYKLRIVVTHTATGVKHSVVKNVTIKANSKYSKSRSDFDGSAYAGQTFPVKVTAPAYQTGAKVVVYYRAPGSSRYVAVSSGRLKASTSTSKATINISKIYNVAGNGGRVYVKIGSASYAPSYQMASRAIVPR